MVGQQVMLWAEKLVEKQASYWVGQMDYKWEFLMADLTAYMKGDKTVDQLVGKQDILQVALLAAWLEL